MKNKIITNKGLQISIIEKDKEDYISLTDMAKVKAYDGDDSWVEDKILEAKKILGGKIPKPSKDCSYCTYVRNSA